MFVCKWICILKDSFQLHVGIRREVLSGNTGEDSVGDEGMETVTGAKTTGSGQQRSNQCHYVCIKGKVNA